MKVVLFYEPKQIPQFDSDGNIIAYSNVIALPASLKDSDNLRVKSSCAERGLSGDRNNAVGFRKTLEVISQSRNLYGISVAPLGADDLAGMAKVSPLVNKVSHE